MCGGEEFSDRAGVTRRTLLAGTAFAAGGLLLGRARLAAAGSTLSTVDLDGVPVIPRSVWGGDLAPAGPIPAEPDVRYLLVHHSAGPSNDYAEGDVAGILRGFVRFHSSPTKGWPDLAYNFLVDRFGRVWEGRTGSLAGPVAGDATGGNQGFDQLCCFIGNHQTGEPTPEAFAAMGRLLGALARRSGIPLGEGATATFTSRGSNRHPAGRQVTTPTIAGHREMSQTQCPGDRVFARLPELRLLAAGRPAATPAPATTSSPSSSTTASPATTAGSPTTAPATTTTVPLPSTAAASPSAAAPSSIPPAAVSAARPPADRTGDAVVPAAVVAGGAAAAAAVGVAGAWARRNRRMSDPPASPSGHGDDGTSTPGL